MFAIFTWKITCVIQQLQLDKKKILCLVTQHPVITAGVGTFKRKQQVREFLEAMPREDVDDIFSSAYMQNKRFEVCFFPFLGFAKIKKFYE